MKRRLFAVTTLVALMFGISLPHVAAAPGRITAFSLGPATSKTYPYSQKLEITYSVSAGVSSPRNFSIDGSSTAANCLLNNQTLTPTLTATSNGTCIIKLTITSDGATRTATFTFNRADQSIQFGSFPTSANFGDEVAPSEFISFNGEPSVTLSVGTSTACSLTSTDLQTSTLQFIRGVGSCRFSVDVAGDSKYNPASAYIDISVSRADQSALSGATLNVSSKKYPYIQSALSVTGVSGGSGTGAAAITSVVSGTATGCAWSNNLLSATSSGTCILTITKAQDDSYNSASTTATFTFLGSPVITSVTPLTFRSGDLVSINGMNLSDVTSVRFGTTDVAINSANATQVRVVAPNSPSTGYLQVFSATGDSATAPTQYSITGSLATLSRSTCPTNSNSTTTNSLTLSGCQTFQIPAVTSNNPSITGVSKLSVSGRDTFTIIGTNLANPSLVQVNASKATVISASATQIVASIRTNISGSYTINVTINGKSAIFSSSS